MKSELTSVYVDDQEKALRFSTEVLGFAKKAKGDYERIAARGAEFILPPIDVTGSTIAMLNDTCGNSIQLTQLARW